MAKPLHERLRGLLPDKVREKIPEKWQPPAWRAPVYAPSPWAGEDLEWNPGDPAEVPLGAYALGDAKGREIEHYIPPGTKGKVVAVAEGFVVFSDGQAGYQLLKSDVRSLVPKKERKWAASEDCPKNPKPEDGHVVDNQGLCHWCGKLLDPSAWGLYAGEHKFPRLSESARSALEIYIFDPVHAEFGDVFPGRLEGSTLYVTKGQEDRAADLLDAASNSAYDDKDTKLVNALVTLYTKVRRAPRTAEARKADLLPGGQGDDMPDDAFDEVELEMGVEDELEHTDDPAVAREIAKDHLVGDPTYYSSHRGTIEVTAAEYVVDESAAKRLLEIWDGEAQRAFAAQYGIETGAQLEWVPVSALKVRPFDERRYAPIEKALESGTPLPPIEAFRDASERLDVTDGQHRVEVARRLGLESVPAVVRWEKRAARTAADEPEWVPPGEGDYDSSSSHLEDVEFYHGTEHDFEDFEARPGTNSTVLFGAYPEKVTRAGFFFTDSPDFARSFAGPHGYMKKVRLRLGSLLDLSKRMPPGLDEYFAAQGIKDLWRFEPGSGGGRKIWQLFDDEYGQRAVAALKAAGYDSVTFREDDAATGAEGRTYVVFDPQQIIKSARTAADETDLAMLLVGPGEVPTIGPEEGAPVADGVARFRSPHGSYRYVMYEAGEPVAALVIVSQDGERGQLAQAFTRADRRRSGLGRQLFEAARTDFKTLVGAEHLSDDGRAWQDAMMSRTAAYYKEDVPLSRVREMWKEHRAKPWGWDERVWHVPVSEAAEWSSLARSPGSHKHDQASWDEMTEKLRGGWDESKPLRVIIHPDVVRVADGNHRLQMMQDAGLTGDVPVVIASFDPHPWAGREAMIEVTAQFNPIVYHGSREPDLDELQSFAPSYAGGIGSGVYVDFDPEVARFYGPYVYELRLKIPEEQILWLTPDTIDYRLGELLPNSILVGEQVLPFSFHIGDQKYSVVADEREALEALAAREMRNALREVGGEWEAFREHFEAAHRWLDVDDAYEYLSDGFIEQGLDVETAEAKAHAMAGWYRGLETQVLANAEKQLGLAIDLSEIGGEAAAAGYRAVYLEGVRARSSVDSELLVFDPADLEMLGQTRTAAGLPAVGGAAKEFAAEVKQGIDQVRGAEYELRPGLFPDKESIEKMLNDVSDVIMSGRGRVPLTSYLDLDLVRSEEARARLKRIGTFVVVDGRTNHGGWFSPSAQLIGINVSPHELTYNSSWQIWQRIKTTFEHEVRHAIDWAYNPDAFVAANPGEESTGAAPKTRRWWTRYLNQPTELMAWAGNIAAALAIRPSSWERLKWSLDDYKVWVEKEGSVRVLDLVKEENKKRLLQMILKAYDQANPPGRKGPNKWQIMKSDLLAKRKIPESFVASLLPFVYGAQKREGMASEPTWQEWVKNRSTDQIVMEAENNYAVYKILRALPKNTLDEYPPLAPMIDDWRQKHGLSYTMRPEVADAWSAWERAS